MAITNSRRKVLSDIGHAVAIGALAAALPHDFAKAQDSGGEDSKTGLSMVYLNTAAKQVRFDGDRWRDSHLPLLREIFGASLERAELRMPSKGRSSRRDPSVLAAAISLWIRDRAEFGKKLSNASGQIMQDLAQITDGQPVVQYDQAIALLGDTRNSVPVGANCMSIYFPYRNGARWDSSYYLETYLPRVTSGLGYKAYRRLEVTEGIIQGETKPAVTSTTHIYVRDQRIFDQAMQTQVAEMMLSEAPNFTDIRPVTGQMTVHASG